jgi:hypothetical protein
MTATRSKVRSKGKVIRIDAVVSGLAAGFLA